MNHRLPFHATVLAAAITCAAAAPATAQHFEPWGDPQPVAEVNTPASEGCPAESPDGLSLYIASNRAGTLGALDIYRSVRASKSSPWSEPENLGPPVNGAAFDYCPTPLPGKWLLFVSSRDTETDEDPSNDDCVPGPPLPGSPSPGDIFLTREHPVHGWIEPVHLGCFPDGPNTAGAEFSPSLVHTPEGTWLYFSSNGYPDSLGHDIYVSQVLADGSVLPGERVEELSTADNDLMPNVRRDGLEIVFVSDRAGAPGQHDIFIATRAHTGDPWSSPVRIDNPDINTGAAETRPALSGDGTRLYFGRNGDIFVSTRAKLRGRD